MRRITFFIGNGFDINVGLDTRYSDFYKYYLSHYPDDMLAKSIDKNYELWSDLESGLGNFTAKVEDGTEDAFWASEEKLENALADYLQSQTERIQISTEMEKTIANKMQQSLLRFQKELTVEQQRFMESLIYTLHDSITYSFICFNYTNALDKCVEITKKLIPKDFGNHKADNATNYTHSLGDVIHIHGTIQEELILGVNDTKQISNQKFQENPWYRQLLVKAEVNKRFGNDKIQTVRSYIDSSVAVCIFGMSLGATDKMWWNYICKWLQGADKRRLIIFSKPDQDMPRITKHRLFFSENIVLENLRVNTGINDAEWNRIVGKIFIKFDSDLFDFKLV